MKITCNQCHRKVSDTSKSRIRHTLRYHPEIPFWRLASIFNPQVMEVLGCRVGDAFMKAIKKHA